MQYYFLVSGTEDARRLVMNGLHILSHEKKIKFYRQLDGSDCGPTCLRIIAQAHGRHYSLQSLKAKVNVGKDGVSLLDISKGAEEIGLHSLGAKLTWETLREEAPLPAILHWQQEHFVVIYKIEKEKAYIADPAYGKVVMLREEVEAAWCADQERGKPIGIALLLEPRPEFYEHEGETSSRNSLSYILTYLRGYRAYVFQLIIGLLLGSLLQLVFPFLTQSIVDFGIGNQNIGFIYLILLAQLLLFIGRTAIEFIRGWILLHISTRLNISLISDFLIKVMKLPIGFFDSKTIGDLIQRINDHKRIETFLTQSGLNTLFSFVNIGVIGIILYYYDPRVLGIFFVGTTLYVGWVFLFLKRRRELDYKSFARLSANQSTVIQLIEGIHEIKLNNLEHQQRWRWEHIQAALFRIQVQSLTLGQYQQAGSDFWAIEQSDFSRTKQGRKRRQAMNLSK